MIDAIVLAAGLSSRMGTFKQLLPYGSQTILERVVSVLRQSPVRDIVVVTGHRANDVAAILASLQSPAVAGSQVRPVFNPAYAAGEMLSSLQTGLLALRPAATAALICMGDQPAIQAGVIARLAAAFANQGPDQLYIPSHAGRAGHPILVPAGFWPALLALPGDGSATARQVIYADTTPRAYILVDTPSILLDIDTPDDYRRELKLRDEEGKSEF